MAINYFSEEKMDYKLINNVWSTKLPVAFCCYPLHRGYLTKGLMDKHECIKKNCPHFRKNETHPYWIQKAHTKAIRKAKKDGKSTYEFNGKTYLLEK